jgi:uncharacterized protein YqeY
MALRDDFTTQMKASMKAHTAARTSTLRMILAKLKDTDIAARPKGFEQVGDDDILAMLRGMVKSRRESIEAAVTAAITATGATSAKEMGKVMAALKASYGASLDMSKVGPIVKAQLA